MKDVTEKALITMPMSSSELTVSDLKHQVTKIQQIMKSVMKPDTHYGNVPGVQNVFLFKAGAEKLCMTFRLIPSYKIDKTVHDGGHITYDVTCTLTHQPSGQVAGEGLGTCSTLEKKYRYRNEDIDTGVDLPSAWWNSRDESKLPMILKNNGVVPKTPAALAREKLSMAAGKVNGKWHVVYRKKTENPDIADVYNTVIKMAKKRSLVDATITALAVSDMFTQDPDAIVPDFEEPETDKETKGADAEASEKTAARRPRRSTARA
jgi:hypothetical protein